MGVFVGNNDVSTVTECQDICSSETTCVGINYGYQEYCRLCHDDELIDSGFTFFRRNGET